MVVKVTIYVIRNSVNDKLYVGQTSLTLEERLNSHFYWAQSDFKIKLSRAIRKNGADKFWIEPILITDDRNADFYERLFIKKWKTKAPNGYNLTDGGEGRRGQICSEETRKKLSLANKGKKRSEETKEKLRLANTGRKHSGEVKFRISLAIMGNKNFKGKKHSEETKEKLRSANLGKKHSEETKEKLRLAALGKKHSEETRLKLRKTTKSYWERKRRESRRSVAG